MFRLLIIATVNTLIIRSSTIAVNMSLKAMDFEVFGRVQGVFFRKYTKEHADKLGLRGWCKNTNEGTVLGHIEGPSDKVEAMMHWLKTEGSPSSKIEKAVYRNPKDITEYTFENFDIIRETD